MSFFFFYTVPKSALFEDFASGAVPARVPVAGVDGGLAQLAVVSRGAEAFKVPLSAGPASGAVLAREGVAGIALGQDFVGDFA